ncbi:hypothetical protein [Aureimonas mangrovi]|uniref:hypothetical protein n=1 Tax=Aureimonas mangrovi TaxID=2758041 RepID=UPI00163D924D|nr:hypothetical protein [Aureimonas mangrovi]
MAKIPLAIIAAVTVAMLAYLIGPAAETQFFPVYSRFTIESIAPSGEGSLVSFRFTKNRDCDARGWP